MVVFAFGRMVDGCRGRTSPAMRSGQCVVAATLAAICLIHSTSGQLTGCDSLVGTWYGGAAGFNSTAFTLTHLAALEVTCGAAGLGVNRTWEDTSNIPVVYDGFTASATGSISTIMSRVYPENVFMGFQYLKDGEQKGVITGVDTNSVTVTLTRPVMTQQKNTTLTSTHKLALHEEGVLEYSITSGAPLNESFVFYLSAKPQEGDGGEVQQVVQEPPPATRTTAVQSEAPRRAASGIPVYNVQLPNNWTLVNETFQWTASTIGMAGLVNRASPRLYLTYPADWPFSYTEQVRDFFQDSRGFEFTNFTSPQEAVTSLVKAGEGGVQGYVVWDPAVRESLIVAWTIAGVEDAVVAGPTQVEAMEALGLKQLVDLRGVFEGMTRPEIYTWASDRYLHRTNTTTMHWAGGACGDRMHPASADFAVQNRAFSTDLSTAPPSQAPSKEDEYVVAKMLVDSLDQSGPEPPLITGWHSYCADDEEHTFTTLASSVGGRVHGLNTLPNLSFNSKIPLPEGYKFKNNHSPALTPARRQELDGDVVVTLVQTDGLGLGAWTRPGRGSIPYSWEVTIVDWQLQPSLLQMFYEQATPNDFFVAALSGPGYMYPRATPPEILPHRLSLAQDQMQLLDLEYMIIFDASDCVGAHTVSGDTNLTRPVVQAYFDSMTETQGFLNGYGPSFSFAHTEGGEGRQGNASVVSFDYYLDPSRTVEDAVDDLRALAALNPVRPYYLAVHVREWSNEEKVEELVQLLEGTPGETFTVLPTDTFFQLANDAPTWLERELSGL